MEIPIYGEYTWLVLFKTGYKLQFPLIAIMNSDKIKGELKRFIEANGQWTTNITLPEGQSTQGHNGFQTRAFRILQIVNDLSLKPISSCKILDLGCLEGVFSLEFALQGAEVTGLDVREANIKKSEFAKELYRLKNLKLVEDDVRNVTVEKYGKYDIIIFSGLLYHLNTPDLFYVTENLYKIVQRLMVIDTHISLTPTTSVEYKGKEYHGHVHREHYPHESEKLRKERVWHSYGNDVSFWLTRPSLVNLLSNVGFSSIYECFTPMHLQEEKPGVYCKDRCTFAAVKGETLKPLSCPSDFSLEDQFPEGTLSY